DAGGPLAVHPTGRGRARVGDPPAGGRAPDAGLLLRAGVVGTAGGRGADPAPQVARVGRPRHARFHEPRRSDLEGALRTIPAPAPDPGSPRPPPAFRVLPLSAGDVEPLNRRLPVWNSGEYLRRLLAQG